MYSTQAYIYQQITQVLLMDTGAGETFIYRYDPVYAKQLTINKGVDNVLLFEFINQYPESAYVGDARNSIEEIDYMNALSLNTTESLTNYLNSHPKSNKNKLIQSKLEALYWEQCLALNSKEAFLKYLVILEPGFR